MKSPLGLAGVRERLTAHGGWRKAYFGHLRRALAWVDKGFGPSAWSTDSYEFTLTMAVIYPFASLFLVWVVTGHDTSGIITLLPNDLPLWRRALILLAACIATFFYYKAIASKSKLQRLVYSICGASMLGVVCIIVNPASAVSLVFLGGVNAIVLTFASTLAGPSVFTGAAALAAAIAGAVVASFYIVAVPVFVAAAGTFVILSIQNLMRWFRLKRLSYFLFVPFALCLLASLSSHPDWLGSAQKVSSFIIIFFALLPLTNSIFDWLSLASTRRLLKSMAARDYAFALLVAGNAITGLVLGVLLLAGLAVTITAALQTLNLLSQAHGGPELFDLAGTLHLLRTNPYDVSVWWVYFTLFSTLLPTVFHATVASASFVIWRLPDSWKKHWLTLIDPTNLKPKFWRRNGDILGISTRYA